MCLTSSHAELYRGGSADRLFRECRDSWSVACPAKLGMSPQYPGVNPGTEHAKSSVTQVMIPLRKRVGRTVGRVLKR